MAKGEGRLEALVPVARLQALEVGHVEALRRRNGVGLAGRHHDGQFATWRGVPEKHVRPSVACGLAPQEQGHDGSHGVPPGRQHLARNLHEHDNILGHLANIGNEAVRVAVQVQIRTVRGLLPCRPADDDRDVSLLGSRSGLSDVVGGCSDDLQACELRAAADAVQGLHVLAPVGGHGDVPTATTRVEVALVPDALALSKPRGVVGLSHRRLANDRDAAHLALAGAGQRQETASILEQHDGLHGDVACERRVLRLSHVLLVPLLAVRRGAGALDVQVVDGCEDPFHCSINLRLGLRRQQRGHKPRARVPARWRRALPGIPDAWVRDPGHVLVRAGWQAHVVQSPPVGLHKASEA
mmetsp:Transcript_88874/g.265129  ORF Transcript_88874/g.265129 Transcript_88874/m.265129 type:complete len:354 (-) Transcript_88874:295-1356(-)